MEKDFHYGLTNQRNVGGDSYNDPMYIPSLMCNKCDILLNDGPYYSYCPKCAGEVDKVDPKKEIYVCPKCNYMINGDYSRKEARKLRCKKCKTIKLKRILGTGKEYTTWQYKSPSKYVKDLFGFEFWTYILPAGSIVIIMLLIIFYKYKIEIGSEVKFLVALGIIPFILFFLLLSYGSFIALAEMISSLGFVGLLISRNSRRIRINHGLEHATINVLVENELPIFGGASNANGFELYTHTSDINIGLAFLEAKQRLENNENKLTISPRCGTTLGVIGLFFFLCIFAVFYLYQIKMLSMEKAYILLIASFFILYFFKYPISNTFQKLFTVSSRFIDANISSVEKLHKNKKHKGHKGNTYCINTNIKY